MKSMSALAASLAFAVAPAALFGATYQNANNDASGAFGSLTNAVRWTLNGKPEGTPSGADGTDLNPEHDYSTANTRLVCTLAGSTAAESLSFKGKSLSVGRVRHKSYGDAIVDWDNGGTGDGLILRDSGNGTAYYTTYSPFSHGGDEAQVYGKVTVQSSDADPYPILFNYAIVFNFHGAFYSEAGKTLKIQYDSAGTFKFSGSLENYNGTIATAGSAAGTLKFGTTTCPGTVLATNAVTITTLAADDVFTVGTLVLGAGTKIAVAYSADGTPTNGIVVATDALEVTGPVTVSVDEAFYETYTNTSTRIPVLTFPASSAVYPDSFSMNRARFVIETDETAGTKTLYAIVTPTVIHNTAKSVSTAGTDWSDGEPVHANASYVLQKVDDAESNLTTPAEGEYAFPGEMLTVNGACTFQPNANCTNLYVKELRLNGSGICMFYNSGVMLRGRVIMPRSSIAYICVYASGTLNLAADVVGDESCRLVMDGRHNSTSSRRGYTRLTGDNSRFFGSITVGLSRDPMTIADSKYQWLYVSDPAKLGAPRKTFSAKALVLKRLGRLAAEGSVTFSDTTRGIYIGYDGNNYGGPGSPNTGGTDSEGQMYVTEGNTLTLLTQLTMNGRLHKYGAGTLALGGPLKFGNEESDEPLANSNLLAVAEGFVKPLAVDSFNGLEMTFAAGTGIKLDIDPQDADLRAYGLRNTKAATPFTANGGTIPVSFDVPADFASSSQPFTLGIVTVPTAIAGDVRNLLAVERPRGFRMEIDTAQDGDDTTIRATLSRSGFCVIVQ